MRINAQKTNNDHYLYHHQKTNIWKRPNQDKTLVIEDDSSLLAPSSINEPECKETLVPTERPEPTTEVTPAGDTFVSQVTPLLGITFRENTQLKSRNTPEI